MAYDSKTYGQSPFGNSSKPESKSTKPGDGKPVVDDGLDQGPEALAPKTPAKPKTDYKSALSGLADRFPKIPTGNSTATGGKTTLGKSPATATNDSNTGTTGKSTSTRKSRTTSKSKSKSTRKSKKAKEAEAARAKEEAAELEIARRFWEEDRSAYLSLLYKTGISSLVWAVLRLSRHELSDNAIAIINIIIHPFVIAALALSAVVGLTFWTRQLLNDLARHTQQLHTDAELTEGKNYRPTIEIIGDSLEYNPKLRKQVAALFNVTSILVCSLVSYLITFALFPTK